MFAGTTCLLLGGISVVRLLVERIPFPEFASVGKFSEESKREEKTASIKAGISLARRGLDFA